MRLAKADKEGPWFQNKNRNPEKLGEATDRHPTDTQRKRTDLID